MATVLLVFFTLVMLLMSIALIFFVLMQRANSNAGMGAAFGGGMAEGAFGAETNNVLSKITIYLTIGFFVLSFCLYLGHLAANSDGERDAPSAMPSLTEVVQDEEDTQSSPVLEPLEDEADGAGDGMDATIPGSESTDDSGADASNAAEDSLSNPGGDAGTSGDAETPAP